MKILHITNWYPSKSTPKNAHFIKKQIDALDLYNNNVVWHLEITRGKFSINKKDNEDESHYLVIGLPFEIWRINEWISFLMVFWVLLKEDTRKFDILNFHIAYPNCTYIHLLKKVIKCPIVITEHWSAYHFNFNVPLTKKLYRIKQIFYHNTPIVTVSKALAKDIQKFSGANFPIYVIPNVVNTKIFYYQPEIQKVNPQSDIQTFFMVSQWKWPKDPFTVINAWPKVIKKFPDALLRIGGYGPQWKEMQELTNKLKLEHNITFIGYMNSEEIAMEMNQATAFIHCSEYETFSVVCAEAVCCGTPVIASQVGGINEFINISNGILFRNEDFSSFFINSFKKISGYDRKSIAFEAQKNLNLNSAGKQYHESLKSIIQQCK